MRRLVVAALLSGGAAVGVSAQEQAFDGLAVDMSSLFRLSGARTRSISPENFTGAKGQGGMATEGTGKEAARDLGQKWKVSPSVKVEAGKTFTLAEITGPGAIQHIWMTPTGTWRFSILRFYWDGETSPSVEVPVGDFFASGAGRYAQVSSLAVAVNPGSAFNCYWPMPFRKSARVTLENLGQGDDDALLPGHLRAGGRAGGRRVPSRAVPPVEPPAVQAGPRDPRRRARAGALRGHTHRLGRPQHGLVG